MADSDSAWTLDEICFCDHIALLHGLLKRGGTGGACQLCDCNSYKHRVDHPANGQADKVWAAIESTPGTEDKVLLIIELLSVVGRHVGIETIDTPTITNFAVDFMNLKSQAVEEGLQSLQNRGLVSLGRDE